MNLRKQSRSTSFFATCGTLTLGAGLAHSAIIISLTPTDNGAAVTVRGALDVSETTMLVSSINGANVAFVRDIAFLAGELFSNPTNIYLGVSSVSDTFTTFTISAPYSGDDIKGFGINGSRAIVPEGHDVTIPVNLAGEYTGAFFSNTNGPLETGLSKTVTLPGGDFITFQTSPDTGSIPEPSTALTLGGLLSIGLLLRSRH